MGHSITLWKQYGNTIIFIVNNNDNNNNNEGCAEIDTLKKKGWLSASGSLSSSVP